MPNVSEQSAIWQPFTQMKTAPAPLAVAKGDGAWLELKDGRRILDCISSWWVTIHGHGHPAIAEAIYAQARILEQVIFAGFTHEPAQRLVCGLRKHLPQNLTRAFFSDDGSTAVEVAIKMAYQYWLNSGVGGRDRFIGFEHGYHGDTLGAMSAGRSSVFWTSYSKLMFPLDTVSFPATHEGDSEIDQKEQTTLFELRKLLEVNKGCYAAIIIEPLIQGAGGMRVCRPQFLLRLEALAHEFDLIVIYDEVMTGFGRTGDWFACLKAGTQPDIACLSKGLTGGFLPLALTFANEKIFQAFYSDDKQKAFFHSHSFTANPISCAAAIASLQLLEANPDCFQRLEQIHKVLINEHLSCLGNNIDKIRTCGTVAAFDVACDDVSYFNTLNHTLREQFLKHGLLLRPLGNTIYLMPPYCISIDELDGAYSKIASVLKSTIVEQG